MNPQDSKDDQHSSRTVESSTIQHTDPKGTTALNLNIDNGMKRATVKERIEKYFYQLTDGCGNDGCSNENCASSGKMAALSPNEAAGMALKLWKSDAKLCDPHPAKIARTSQSTGTKAATPVVHTVGAATVPVDASVLSDCAKTFEAPKKAYLTERKLHSVLEECKSVENYTQLRIVLFQVFSNQDFLSESFRIPRTREDLDEYYPQHVIDAMTSEQLSKYPSSIPPTKKTTIDHPQSTQSEPTVVPPDTIDDPTKLSSENQAPSNSTSSAHPRNSCESSNSEDSSSSAHPSSSTSINPNTSSTQPSSTIEDSELTVDLESLRRAYGELFSVPHAEFENSLVQALVTLCEYLNVQLKAHSYLYEATSIVHSLLIILEIPTLGSCDYVERVLAKLCKVATQLPLTSHASIARIWALHCKTRLKSILEALQQLITIKTISNHYHKDYVIQDEETITLPTKIMRILFYANILAGDLDSPSLRTEAPETEETASRHESIFGVDIPSSKSSHQTTYEDPLGKLLGVNVLDSRKPYIPFLEFYNEPLSDAVEMDRDFGNYRTNEEIQSEPDYAHSSLYIKFSFMYYSFILSPATKSQGLYFDSRIRMYSGRRISYLQSVVGQPTNPYLRLKVRRDHIIEDALVELEMIAMENEKDLKKQLVVEFEGEQGIDEGGVSKEFFQLIIDEIFNPDYGMFVLHSETQHMWFNQISFESDAQFTLVGIILGLAIYNNIILDVKFPMVVYKKLMGKRGSFHDLEDFNPVLYNGLCDLLAYEGVDIEDVFAQTFRICFTDPFGSVISHDLKPNGDNILVNQDNKRDFVDMYADFLLNHSVEKQFKAFRRGFQMVTDESPLALLFRPEEIEQLVCGSKIFDLHELQESTEYDAGYTAESSIIKHFWEIVHAMSHEDQKRLLQFTTGSDRIPVGGFSKLKMFIARTGPDSDRLPTAHTCFNVLLLPEYESKEKLQDRLLKAINYSKGFGLL